MISHAQSKIQLDSSRESIAEQPKETNSLNGLQIIASPFPNAVKIITKEKLNKCVSKSLKNRFKAYWSDSNWTVPIKHKITVEGYLKKEGIDYRLEDTWERFHSLTPPEQLTEKLNQAERYEGAQGFKILDHLNEYIEDYNSLWGAELKAKDFIGKSIDEIRGLANSDAPRQTEHLNIIFEISNKVDEKRKNVVQITEKIKRLKEESSNPDTLRYGNYFVNESGLYLSPEQKTESESDIWISSSIRPEAYLRDKEGKSHTLLIKISDGERDHKIALPRRIITKWAELSELLLDLGQLVPTSPANQKHLQQFLMQARPEKLMRCVDKSGWHGEQYIFPDGEVLGKTTESNESVYPLNEAIPRGIEKKGTLQDWKDTILKLCASNSRLIFSIGVSLSAPCLQLAGDEGGVFNFKGASSIGKTRCLMVAISVFGSPDFKRSWRTTSNGLEGVCSLHNDCLLALDEFGQSNANEVGEIAYMYSQGIGKQRSDRAGSPREPKTWRGMLFSTGEVGISDHMQDEKNKPKAGQLVRVIDIPAEVKNAFGCFEELHGYENGVDGERFADKIKEVCGEYYGIAGREFIRAVIEFGIEKSKKHLRFSRDDFAATVASKYDGQVKRVANRFGLVNAALSLGIDLGILSEYLTREMCEKSVRTCFNDWLNDRGTTGSFESYSIINQVVGLLNENSDSKFISRNDLEDKRIRTTLWGYKEGATFYVFPKAFKESLCKGCGEQNTKAALIEKGLLIPGNDGKSSKSVRIQAHSKPKDRFYVIDLNNVKDDEDDEDDATSS